MRKDVRRRLVAEATMGHDFEPREIRSYDVEGDLAPEIGQRLTPSRRPDVPAGEFVPEYGDGPWEIVDVLPISARPGWVRVYAVFVEGLVADSWEDDDEPTAG
jgi:hypothetical protein